MTKAWFLETSEIIKGFMDSSVIMQWNNVRKSILILLMGGFYYLFWVIWLAFSFYSPSLTQWINPDYFVIYFYVFVLGTLLFFVLSYITYHYRQRPFIQRYMPYAAVAYLGIMMLLAGYSIGIISPATIAGYINLVTVGLVLHERRMIYPTFVPITLLLLFLIVMSANEMVVYAPLFSEMLNNQVLYENPYWIGSMIFLYTPIFIAGLGLFEVLLTQWRNRELLINEISRKDALTGIDNRRSIGQYLEEIERHKIAYAVVLLDLDYFKQINDQYGHESGDLVLIEVAKILKQHVIRSDQSPTAFQKSKIKLKPLNDQDVNNQGAGDPESYQQKNYHLKNSAQQNTDQENLVHFKKSTLKSKWAFQSFQSNLTQKDVVGRYGGEEFIIIFVNQTLEYVLKKTELCRQMIEQAVIHTEDHPAFSLTASFGVAFSQDEITKVDTIRMADQALYQAKHNGRNQVICFNSEVSLFQQQG